MKKLTIMLALAILLAGGAVAALSGPAQAQYSQYGYNYPPRLGIVTLSLGSGLIRRGSITTVTGL
jgi:hypothetical protein